MSTLDLIKNNMFSSLKDISNIWLYLNYFNKNILQDSFNRYESIINGCKSFDELLNNSKNIFKDNTNVYQEKNCDSLYYFLILYMDKIQKHGWNGMNYINER